MNAISPPFILGYEFREHIMFPEFTSKNDESHKPIFNVILIVKQPFSTAHLVMESCAVLIIKYINA